MMIDSGEEKKVLKIVGGRNLDETVCANSSSGGAFFSLAEKIIHQGGVVYGCVLDENLHAIHRRAETIEDIKSMCGSKYVQSEMGNVYKYIAQDIRERRQVMFTGTPCQCAGVLRYLQVEEGIHYEEGRKCLLNVDFICHGVPSPTVFDAYVKHLEEKRGSKVIKFLFRNKEYGWRDRMQTGTRIEFADGSIIRNSPAFKDAYMCGFLSDVFLRPSCYKCKFKSLPKDYSDITIADFWGVSKYYPELNSNKGASLLLINTKNGEQIFDEISKKFPFKEVDFDKATKCNPSLIYSSPYRNDREEFFCDFSSKPFNKVQKKYLTAYKWAHHRAGQILGGIFKRAVNQISANVFNLIPFKWKERRKEVILQFIRFCVVGVSNVIIAYCTNILSLIILRMFLWKYDYIAANTISFVLSVLWAYYLSSNIVFIQFAKRKDRIRSLFKTYIAYGFTGLILNNILSFVWISVFDISKYIAPLLNLPFSIPVNFIINKYWTYGKSCNERRKGMRRFGQKYYGKDDMCFNRKE